MRMYRWLSAVFLGLAGCFPAAAVPADAPPTTLLRIQAVPLQCARVPCPSRAISAVDAAAAPAGLRPRLFLLERPPRFDAVPELRERLDLAWRQGECVLVQGSLLQDVLIVVRFVGVCEAGS